MSTRFSAISHRIPLALRCLALAPFFTVVGCGSPDATESSSDGVPPGFTKDQLPKVLLPDLPLVAPKSDLDVPLFSDIVDVGPGEDVTFCTFTKLIVDKDTVFGESFGAQSPQGHHAIL